MDDIYSGRYVGYINIDGKVRITARQMQDANKSYRYEEATLPGI